MSEQLLIVGIDPGTTVAFAAIDLNGNIVKVFSQKEVSLSYLIKKVIELGKPVLVGCDVTPAPTFVEKFTTKTGAKLIDPDTDLTVDEKKKLVKDFEDKIQNNHQRDALSSALFAYKIVNPLLKKIDKILKKEKKEHLSAKVKELLLKKEIAIKTAIDIIEKPEEPAVKIIKKAVQKRILSEKNFLVLYDKLKQKENEINLLKNSNENMKKELQESQNKINFLLKKIPPPSKKIKQKISFKEKRIDFLTVELEKMKMQMQSLQKNVENLNQFVANLNNNILLKKLDNLGSDDFESKNRILNIQKNDFLLVNDLDIYSKKIIDSLKNKNITIICRKASNKTKQSLPFVIIDSKNLKIKEDDLFAAISRKEFQEIKTKQNILTKIIEEYKETRTKD